MTKLTFQYSLTLDNSCGPILSMTIIFIVRQGQNFLKRLIGRLVASLFLCWTIVSSFYVTYKVAFHTDTMEYDYNNTCCLVKHIQLKYFVPLSRYLMLVQKVTRPKSAFAKPRNCDARQLDGPVFVYQA